MILLFQAMIVLISNMRFPPCIVSTNVHHSSRNFNTQCSCTCMCVSIGVNEHFKNDSFDNEGATE